MEIEINFRLDEDGRTANTKKRKTNGADNDDGNSGREETNNVDDDGTCTSIALDYTPKVFMTNLQDFDLPKIAQDAGKITTTTSLDGDNDDTDNHHHGPSSLLDDLLLDCEISDCGLMPRTFWMPAKGMKPRCSLEQFALDIFHHHVPSNIDYDHETSGAEWWCQLRPSPEKTGRYAMHRSSDDKEDDDPFANGISMHVDKDEELRILTGGNTYIHPHFSTVTYLTNLGSPTLIMDCRVHPLIGTWIVPEGTVQGFVTWPVVGKHVKFDGRYLHAAPPDFMMDGVFDKQMEFSPKENDEKWNKVRRRRHRRVTFLVNIWLNYRPFDVKPFPDTMVDKMSGQNESKRKHLEFVLPELSSTASGCDALNVRRTTVTSTSAIDTTATTNSYKTRQFTWPLGGKYSVEKLQVEIPLESIHKEASSGGNVEIHWHCRKGEYRCFRLYEAKSNDKEGDIATYNIKREGNDSTLQTEDGTGDVDDAKRPRVD